MSDPDEAWQQARWLVGQREEIARLVEAGELDPAGADARWNATLVAVPFDALPMAARWMVWREEQQGEP